MTRPILIGALAALALALPTSSALAHVRWFTDPNDPVLANFPTYALSDPAVLAWIAIGVVLVSAAVLLDARLPSIPIVNTKIRHDAMELLRVLTGMSLLLTAYGGELLAPHLTAYGGFGTALVFLQAVIGIMLIANNMVHHAAILIVLLFLGTVVKFGLIPAFEYVNVVGIAVFLFCNHVPNETWRARLK
ncbi:MAG: hypothetical protein AAGI34_12080, partial [Pseudomonadota bacterium]